MRQAVGHRRSGKRWPVVSAAAAGLVAVGVVGYLVISSLPASNADTARGALTVADGAGSTVSSSPMSLLSPTPAATSASAARPSPTSSPSTKAPATSSAPAPAGAASLAGRIRPGTTYQGVATEYSAADGDGACLFGPAANMMIAAMNYTDYESAKACGAYVRVHAANGASITVLITNECPLPCAPGQLDLSQQAFAKLANPSAGRIPVTWSLVSPSLSSTISIRYKTGSSQYWCGIQVIGHRNPVALLEVRSGGAWRSLPRAEYNYFISSSGAGCGGPIRITDIYGQQLVVNGIAISPNVAQATSVQFAQH